MALTIMPTESLDRSAERAGTLTGMILITGIGREAAVAAGGRHLVPARLRQAASRLRG